MIRVVIKHGEGRRVAGGHLWVFSNEIDRVEEQPGHPYSPGCLATLVEASGRSLGWGYYNRSSLIAFRLLSLSPETDVDELLVDRISRALDFRKKIYGVEDCYRLVNSEGDLLPGLIVDRYGDCLVVQYLTAGIEALGSKILRVLTDLLAPRAIVLRNDGPIRGLEGLGSAVEVAHGSLSGPIKVRMDGLEFLLDLTGGQKTGFFLDQRENRQALGRYVRNASVLDLFSYQGSWGLYALRAGARSVLAIDGSSSALQLAKDTAGANGFEGRLTTREGDGFDVLKDLAREGALFDVAVVDPPAFARTKKDAHAARIAYERVNKLAVRVLAKGGILATSTCSYHVDRDEFLGCVYKGIRSQGRTARVLEVRGQGVDHAPLLSMPEGAYLKCVFLEVL